MASHSNSLSPDSFPLELVTSVAESAERDATRVVQFLNLLGFKASAKCPWHLPGAAMLRLGAALCLLSWEEHGFDIHRRAGLPDAYQAIRDAVLSLAEFNSDNGELCGAVMRLSIERLAWNARPELGADVLLDDPPEEALLNILADYLWNLHRRNRTGSPLT